MIKTFLNQTYQKVLNQFRYGTPDVGYNPIDKKKFKNYNAIRENGALPLFCYVPFNSLTFSFQGKVYACTYNREIMLGTYPQNTIKEIWTGEEANKLRDHMRHNDLDYGCQHCKYFFDKGKFSNLKPFVFDKYADIDKTIFPRVLEFELSNECNLECQMCSGEVSSSIRKNRENRTPISMPYDLQFVEQLKPFIPYLKEAKFFGGEPFLISIYFNIWEQMLKIKPDIKFFVITNGTHWNNKIASLLERGHFDIAISIDSLDKQKLEKIRKNVIYEKLIENIHRFNEYALRNNRRISLSFTLQKENWEDLSRMISFCNELKAHIYVSYLEWPILFAISDLPLEDLQGIKKEIAHLSFPQTESYELHNNKCFEDFRNFINKLIDEGNKKTYVDYRFGEIMEMDKVQSNGNSDSPEIEILTIEEYQSLFENKMRAYYETTKDTIDDKIQKQVKVKNKLLDVMAQFNAEEKMLIYKNLFKSPWRMTMLSLLQTPVDQLVLDCKGLLSNR